jgi:eukaryotic-like serine/threonine-protein kinase
VGEFVKRERLGAGHFGEVWLEFDQALGANRAVKYIRPGKIVSPNETFREAQLLAKLAHPNVVPVYEAGRLQDGTIYIAMEYCKRGSVESRHKGRPLPLKRARKVVVDILRGLEFAHRKGVLHRDIKPANILCKTSLDYVLSDFGLAALLGSRETQKCYAYMAHLAPEVLKTGTFAKPADIYAAGVTAYRLINGDSMFSSFPTTAELRRGILDGTHPRRDRYRIYVPKRLRAVVNRALEVEPQKRFSSAEEFRHALEQVSISCSWAEEATKDGPTWRTEQKGVSTELRVSRTAHGVYYLVALRGRKPKLRLLRRLATSASHQQEILRQVGKIAQGMVDGKSLSKLLA